MTQEQAQVEDARLRAYRYHEAELVRIEHALVLLEREARDNQRSRPDDKFKSPNEVVKLVVSDTSVDLYPSFLLGDVEQVLRALLGVHKSAMEAL